mmetsp:Transcript_11746/g.42030  ORF Transcript_11746/g.42030 Transcript_11746/m.42030 type:complete len:310 (-) Transcript_11746:74-1003(-)
MLHCTLALPPCARTGAAKASPEPRPRGKWQRRWVSNHDFAGVDLPRVLRSLQHLRQVRIRGRGAGLRAEVEAQTCRDLRLLQGGDADAGHVRAADGRRVNGEVVVVADDELRRQGRCVQKAARLHNGEGQARGHELSLKVQLVEADVPEGILGVLRRGGAHGGDQHHLAQACARRGVREGSESGLGANPVHGHRVAARREVAIRVLGADRDRAASDDQGASAFHRCDQGVRLRHITDEDALALVALRASQVLPSLGDIPHEGPHWKVLALQLRVHQAACSPSSTSHNDRTVAEGSDRNKSGQECAKRQG